MYRVWRGIKKGFVTFVCVGDDRKGRGTECMCLVVKQLEKGMCLVQMAHIYICLCCDHSICSIILVAFSQQASWS